MDCLQDCLRGLKSASRNASISGIAITVAALLVSAGMPANAADAPKADAPKAQPAAKAQPGKAPQAAKAATSPARPNTQAELDSLAKAAKAEGELLFYTGTVDNVAKRLADAFQAKYGIKASFLRLSGAPLTQRYFTEAESGNIAADVLLTTGSPVKSAEEGIAKGWVESVSKAGIPAIASGEFPSRFLLGSTAIVSIFPYGIAYNTSRLKDTDRPKQWPDLLNPKFRDQIGVGDPSTGEGYIAFWSLMQDKYGNSFFERLRALNLRTRKTQ